MIAVKQQAIQEWQQLAPREQGLLMVSIPLALGLCLFLAVRGLLSWQTGIQAQVDSRTAQLAEMELIASAIVSTRMVSDPDNAVVRAGQRLSIWEGAVVYDAGENQASIENRPFVSVLNWLEFLEDQGVIATSLRLTRFEPGRISGTVYFQEEYFGEGQEAQ